MRRYWMVSDDQFQEAPRSVVLEALADNACDYALCVEWTGEKDNVPSLKKVELKEEEI